MCSCSCPFHALVSLLLTTACSEVQHTCPYLTTKGHCSLSWVPWSRRARLNLQERGPARDGVSCSLQCQPLKVTQDTQICWAVLSFRSSLYRNTTFPPNSQRNFFASYSSGYPPFLVLPPSLVRCAPSLAPSFFFLRGIRSNPAAVNLIPLIQLI